MFLVVTVDRNWAISKNGGLLYDIPTDKATLCELTRDKTIVYERKVLESFPNGEPLPLCRNIIFTHSRAFKRENVTIIHSLRSLRRYADNDLYVVGGKKLYHRLYNKCQYAFVTHIDADSGNTACFPNIISEGWEKITETPFLTYNGIRYQFVTYRNPAFVDKKAAL